MQKVSKMSDAALLQMKAFEGCRLLAYRDAVGVWTIGYGHTRTAKAGQRITQAQADALLRQDLARFEEGVARLVSVPITQGQFDALVSFAYNLGLGALQRSTLLRYINAKAGSDLICAEFLKWNKAGGKVLAGLSRRRTWEASLWRKG